MQKTNLTSLGNRFAKSRERKPPRHFGRYDRRYERLSRCRHGQIAQQTLAEQSRDTAKKPASRAFSSSDVLQPPQTYESIDEDNPWQSPDDENWDMSMLTASKKSCIDGRPEDGEKMSPDITQSDLSQKYGEIYLLAAMGCSSRVAKMRLAWRGQVVAHSCHPNPRTLKTRIGTQLRPVMKVWSYQLQKKETGN